MQSKAKTVKKYLNELQEDRRSQIGLVRQTILRNLPKGYKEGMQYGMITYFVPLSIYPKGYLNKKDIPLPYVSLASQKNHMAIYLNNIYQDSKIGEWFHKEYDKSGKRKDIGKSCVRFKRVEDLPLSLIGKVIAKTPVEKYIKNYEKARGVLRN